MYLLKPHYLLNEAGLLNIFHSLFCSGFVLHCEIHLYLLKQESSGRRYELFLQGCFFHLALQAFSFFFYYLNRILALATIYWCMLNREMYEMLNLTISGYYVILWCITECNTRSLSISLLYSVRILSQPSNMKQQQHVLGSPLSTCLIFPC